MNHPAHLLTLPPLGGKSIANRVEVVALVTHAGSVIYIVRLVLAENLHLIKNTSSVVTHHIVAAAINCFNGFPQL